MSLERQDSPSPTLPEAWRLVLVLFLLTAAEVAVSRAPLPPGLVVAVLLTLAVVQALYFVLAVMGLSRGTPALKYSVAIPLLLAVLYAAVLCSDALWRSAALVST